MAYLDNSTITVDAILTKKGRELFAKSSADFKITKFALADDEIDYRLYDKTHPSGSAYYADAIENLPILEALPDDSKMLKYKLVSLPKNTTSGFVITVAQTAYSQFWMPETYANSAGGARQNTQPASEAVIIPQTSAGGDASLGYTATLFDSSYIDLTVSETIGSQSVKRVDPLSIADGYPTSVTQIGRKFLIKAKALPANVDTSGDIELRINGNESGASVRIIINVKRRSVYDPDDSSVL